MKTKINYKFNSDGSLITTKNTCVCKSFDGDVACMICGGGM